MLSKLGGDAISKDAYYIYYPSLSIPLTILIVGYLIGFYMAKPIYGWSDETTLLAYFITSIILMLFFKGVSTHIIKIDKGSISCFGFIWYARIEKKDVEKAYLLLPNSLMVFQSRKPQSMLKKFKKGQFSGFYAVLIPPKATGDIIKIFNPEILHYDSEEKLWK